MAFLKAYINTFINQRKKIFWNAFSNFFPPPQSRHTYNHHAPFCCDYCIGSRFFFPFLGLVTTAASHSSNNLFAYHKMHWRILPAFSIWPLPSHFPCTSTQCITTSTLVSLSLSLCIRIASIKCSLTRTNAILKGCAPDFTTCFRTYTYEITFMTQSKCILANTLSLSLSLLISSWAKE